MRLFSCEPGRLDSFLCFAYKEFLFLSFFLIRSTKWLEFNVLSTNCMPTVCSSLPVASKAGFSLESPRELLKSSYYTTP